MSTHGVFKLRIDNTIWGWHLTHDGYNVIEFYKQNKHLTNVQEIFMKACEYFADEEYDDRPSLNFYKREYDPDNDDCTEYILYFDGKWKKDWEDEK